MLKAKVLGVVKPETIVCWAGKQLYFVRTCYNEDSRQNENHKPNVGDIVYFDEWFWSGIYAQLKEVLDG